MAKSPAKKAVTATKAPAKKAAAKKVTPSPAAIIEKACEATLAKLQQLSLDPQLQSEIDWCLASYRGDGNPVGLYQMIERAVALFKGELAAKKKGVTAKMIADLEKALAAR